MGKPDPGFDVAVADESAGAVRQLLRKARALSDRPRGMRGRTSGPGPIPPNFSSPFRSPKLRKEAGTACPLPRHSPLSPRILNSCFVPY